MSTGMKFSIRRRLLAVAMLGGITFVLAVVALGWPFGSANRQRLARARDGVEQELARLRANVPPQASGIAMRVEGPMELRSGVLEEGGTPADLDLQGVPEAGRMVSDAVTRSRATGTTILLDHQTA